jgi:hypothetical protein
MMTPSYHNIPGHTVSGRKRLLATLTLCCLLAGSVLATDAQAGEERGGRVQNGASSYFSSNPPGVSLQKATAMVRKRTGGRVLSATTRQNNGGEEHLVRVLVDGERVVTMVVDDQGRIRNDGR